MIQNILKILSIIILAILQITLMPHLGFQTIWPNLILLVALVLMFLDFEVESLLVAIVGGLILDLASPLFFGLHSVILIILILITKLLLTKFLTEPNAVIIGLFLVIASFFNESLVMLITRNFLWLPVLINGFYSAIIGLILYRFFEYWFKKQPIIKMMIQ